METKEWRHLERFCDILDHASQQAGIPPTPREPDEKMLHQLVAEADPHDIANIRTLLWLTHRHVEDIRLYVEGEAGRPERGRINNVRHVPDPEYDCAIAVVTRPYRDTVIQPRNVWIQQGEILNAAIIIEGHATPESKPVYFVTTTQTRLAKDARERLRVVDLVYAMGVIDRQEIEEPTGEYVVRSLHP